MKMTKTQLQKLADRAGISIGVADGGPYPTIAQLEAFAKEVAAKCAEKCQAIAEVHQRTETTYAAGQKAGALECAESLKG
jgi:hypothetical protein